MIQPFLKLQGLFCEIQEKNKISQKPFCLFQASDSGENRGVTLDDFNMLRVIGRGSYAKVLMAEQKRTKRLYAMKVIKKELVNDDEVSSCFQNTLMRKKGLYMIS